MRSVDDLIEAMIDYHASRSRIELRVRRGGKPIAITFEERGI